MHHALTAATSAYQVFHYTSKAFNNTYRFNNQPMGQADAQARCSDQGGHLVSYTAQSEQGEVEKYFQDQGYLFPYYHKNYWLGAMASPWPTFVWMDPTTLAPSTDTYQNWGMYVDSKGSFNEPNNREGSEFCAVANFTESIGATWGWADSACTGRAWPFICMTKREHLATLIPNSPLLYLQHSAIPEYCSRPRLPACLPACLPVAPAAPGAVIPPAYAVNSTRNTFIYRTSNLSFSAASGECNLWGGHLATYVRFGSLGRWPRAAWMLSAVLQAADTLTAVPYHAPATDLPVSDVHQAFEAVQTTQTLPCNCSVREQREVERYYISSGYLFPKYHLFYWIGISTPTTDPIAFNWIDPTSGNLTSTSYQHWGQGATGNPPDMGSEPNNYMGDEKCVVANYTMTYEDAWGWGDAQCGIKATFMCRLIGGWLDRWLAAWQGSVYRYSVC
jgi:hypothetical protein